MEFGEVIVGLQYGVALAKDMTVLRLCHWLQISVDFGMLCGVVALQALKRGEGKVGGELGWGSEVRWEQLPSPRSVLHNQEWSFLLLSCFFFVKKSFTQ